MNIQTIKKMQRKHGLDMLQYAIDNGQAFKQHDHKRDFAWSMIYAGACMLPKVIHRDHDGRMIAARQMLPDGSVGTFKWCKNYWINFVAQHNTIK